MIRGHVNTLHVEGQQGMPVMSYTVPFQYGIQVRNEEDYKVHQYIDERKFSCFKNPFQTPYPKINIDLKYFKIICEDSDNINRGDINGQTPLHALCLYGSINAIKMVLVAGADVFSEDMAGFSAAHYCCIADRADLLKYLDTNCGADVTKQALSTSRTPLHIASMCNSAECVKYLLKSGVNLNQVDNYGYTALWLAMYYRNSEICVLLSECGAELDIMEVDKISFVFRALEKCPGYGERLLDSFITRCNYRNVSCIWLNGFVNGNSYETADLTHTYLYQTTLQKKFIEHPVIKTYTHAAWIKFGRRKSVFDLINTLFCCLLWTLHFMFDDGKTFKNGNNLIKLIAYCVLLPYMCFMFYCMISRLRCLMKKQLEYIKFEMEMVFKEIDNLHPCMWTANHVLISEKKKIREVKSGMAVIDVIGGHLSELLIYILSGLVLLLDIVMAVIESNEERKPHINHFYFVISSIVIVIIWGSSFNKLRHFKEFGAFIISIQHLANLMTKFSCMFLMFYIPTACIFWKTLYEPSNRLNNKISDNSSLHTVSFVDAFYRIYRLTYRDYTYSDGLDRATNLGIPDWWNVLTFYWITLGGIILMNIFGAMVFKILTKPLNDDKYTVGKERLFYICEMIMNQDQRKRQEFVRYLQLECNPYMTDKFIEETKDVRSIDKLEEKITKLQNEMYQLTEMFGVEQSTSSMNI